MPPNSKTQTNKVGLTETSAEPLYLMIYQFFHCKRKLWRIPIVFSPLLDLLVIDVSYSRSVRLSMALAFLFFVIRRAVFCLVAQFIRRPLICCVWHCP